MRSYLSAITLIGFIAIAIFGFTAMAHQTSFSSHGSGFEKCIAATVGGTDCPQNESPYFHVNTFKKFSAAVLAYSFFIFLGIMVISRNRITDLPSNRLVSVVIGRDKESSPPRQKFVLANWISLHENSPAVI